MHDVRFRPSGRGKARCSANPAYPNGIAINLDEERKSCLVTLPYPAPECGHFVIDCHNCDMRVLVTAAGRADDPVSVRMPCALVRPLTCADAGGTIRLVN